ncbi:MAG: SDR family NAD(P)-dependent oxidoreductase, partial [Brevibacterium sp.]|nr:SDR family NAD(P)-dependent oxidoreductase [Brevibacterium sp.]
MTNAPATTAESNAQGVSEVPGLLAGKVAVVTGGAQGLGLSMARSLVNSGAKVVLGDMNEESLQA